ncbi:MAG: response regulator [Deltaproteobacteria bacterium]|jgi:response regulator of citrate/malate metabolism|nr:response regulator [Deltaproteobacteria bacterium]
MPLKAIIVEDDPMVAQINGRYLSQMPELTLAGVFPNGQTALDYLKANPVDLVILDVYMPELNGVELFRIMRRLGLTAEVIMVTAANDARHVDELLRLGVVDYLVKPFTEARFIDALEKCVARRRSLATSTALSQQAIDRLMGQTPPPSLKVKCVPQNLPKGLQAATMALILKSLPSSSSDYLSCEELASAIGLSKVTVRRYLNHLIGETTVDSLVDYDTGGRPSVKYRLR